MRRWLYATFAIILSVFMLSCDEDAETEPTTPTTRVVSVGVAEGDEVACDAYITVIFSEMMNAGSVVISLNGTPVSATSTDGMTFKFQTGMEGEFELTIDGKDIYGNELDPPYEPIVFRVTAPDRTPPEISDLECDPMNGSMYVDPAGYTGVVIAFDEPMAEARVTSTEPEIRYTEELTDDGRNLVISFVQYSLPNETIFTVKLTGSDLAGNPLGIAEYSFITLVMENGGRWGDWVDISMSPAITLEPFQEITFEFDLKGRERLVEGDFVAKLASLYLNLFVLDTTDLTALINGHEIGKLSGTAGVWQWSVRTEFEMDLLDFDGINFLTIVNNKSKSRIRNITILLNSDGPQPL